jgi:23S rRNA (uridine2552-2'-O)-methyltransferase
MKRNRTSKAWMREHVTDVYVKRAKAEGYRSRAAYKLIEIDQRERLLRPGQLVVDLGAAPGGWSQVAAQRVSAAGRVLAIDLLGMAPIPGVEFVQADFSADEGLARILALLGDRQAELVLSDMAPNLSGIAVTDAARMSLLAELGLEFAAAHLRPGGDFLIKVFHGRGFEELRRAMRPLFEQVLVRKPGASRERSSEVYLLGRGKK